MNEEVNNSLSLELDAEVAKGVYSNVVMIAHSPSEFILDFASILPGMPKGKVVSRIIMTPENAKRLLISLNENIARYESQIKHIDLGMQETPITMKGGKA